MTKSTKKPTIDEIKEIVFNVYGNDIVLLSNKYINAHTKLKWNCKTHGVFYREWTTRMKQGKGCPKCSREKVGKYSLKSTNNYKKSIQNVLNDFDMLTDYNGAYNSIDFKCKHCGSVLSRTAKYVSQNGIKCTCMGGRKRYSTFDIKLMIKERWGDDILLCSKYKTMNDKVKLFCNICHNYTYVSPHNMFRTYNTPCSSCYKKSNMSNGEILVMNYLNAKSIDFLYGYILPNNLHLDFYIPSKHIGIEYDGEQHFKPLKHFGGKQGLNIRKQRDRKKDDYCNSHKIKLIRIPYTLNNKDLVYSYLNEYL